VTRQFRQVDVFTTVPYLGNPLAVVLDGAGLSDDEMQQFARWTNLSETTFVVPPRVGYADYQVRIFTTEQELPFAGHPTLGTCHAWLEAGGTPRSPGVVVQECGAGLVQIRREPDNLAFAAPPLVREGPVDEDLALHLAEIIGIGRDQIVDLQWADNGPGWVAVLLSSAEAVLAARPGPTDVDFGLAGPYPDGSPEAFEVRTFIPAGDSVIEDPVTGSFNASLAQWLLSSGRATAPYTVSQGTILGRRGRVRISQDPDGTVWTGGSTITCVTGSVEL